MGRSYRVVAWTTALVISVLALTMVVSLAAQALGYDLFALMTG